MRLADQLVDRIVASSHLTRKRRDEIERELRAHIEDFADAEQRSGCGAYEIEQHVLAHFGNPDQIATGFAMVYRQERRILRALTFVLSTFLLASFLFGAILTTQTGVAFGFGTPIANIIASRHAAIQGLDIVTSVAAYLGLILLESVFETARFPKASGLLALIVSVVVALCATVGAHISFFVFGLVNGIFTRAIQLFVRGMTARVGIAIICFPLTGLVLALRWLPASHITAAMTCISWLVAGTGYQLMAYWAARVDRTLLRWIEQVH